MTEPDRAIVAASDSVSKETVGAGAGTTRQVLIGAADAPHFAMRLFTIEAGGSMPQHTNSVEHEQFVLKGKARVGIGEDVYTVQAGDFVLIPANVPHWYRTEGREACEFLCVVPNLPDEIRICDDA